MGSVGGDSANRSASRNRRSSERWGGRRAEKARERLETTLPILAHGIRLRIPGTPKMVGALMQMLESANALQQQQEPDGDEIRLQPPPMAPGPSHASVAGSSRAPVPRPPHAPALGPVHPTVEYPPSATAMPPMHTAPEPIPPYGGALPASRMRSTSADVTSYGAIPTGSSVYQQQLPLEQGVPLPATSNFLDEFFSSFMPMDTSNDNHPVRSLLLTCVVRSLTCFIHVCQQTASTMSYSAWPSAGGLDFFALPNSLPSPSNSDHVGSAPAPQIVPGLPMLSPQEQMHMHNQNRQFRTEYRDEVSGASGQGPSGSAYGGAGGGMRGM